MPFIKCQQVVKAYKVADHEIVALRGIDFEMEQGEMVAIIGPSGAGKSSLMNLLGGLDTPTAGKLLVGEQNLLELKGRRLAEYRLRQVGFIWQMVSQNLLAHRSALANVTLPMMLAGVPVWRRRRQARALLERVGLQAHLHKRPGQLSGGQQQRVAVAVALANTPQLLLADEPTGALDRTNARQVMDLLNDLRRTLHLTVLLVTHDLEVAAHADRILTLRDGALAQDMSGREAQGPRLDDAGRIQLPPGVQTRLAEADRIAVEIRPEGVLLRPEVAEADHTDALLQDMLPQDVPPEKRRWFGRGRRKKP
ncbi:MAG: ABC transporter ATP-binding protein [Anaerolineae bacterium]|nr:ABC transporter ATP-binding protein [Anaerolineae bacterium]